MQKKLERAERSVAIRGDGEVAQGVGGGGIGKLGERDTGRGVEVRERGGGALGAGILAQLAGVDLVFRGDGGLAVAVRALHVLLTEGRGIRLACRCLPGPGKHLLRRRLGRGVIAQARNDGDAEGQHRDGRSSDEEGTALLLGRLCETFQEGVGALLLFGGERLVGDGVSRSKLGERIVHDGCP